MECSLIKESSLYLKFRTKEDLKEKHTYYLDHLPYLLINLWVFF